MVPQDLIDHADAQLRSRRGAPRQVDLRRAISASYYALFHALLRAAADELVGRSAAKRRSPAYAMVYRAFEHAKMERDCRDILKPTLPAAFAEATGLMAFSSELQTVAASFISLQEDRHNADYNPNYRFSKSDAEAAIAEATHGISQFESANDAQKRLFLMCLLFKRR